MSKEKTDVLLIPAERLEGFPKGIQAYVRCYGEKLPLGGAEYFVLSWATDYRERKNLFVKGVAPKFPENATHFREGLNAGVAPHLWLLDASEDASRSGVTRIFHEWTTGTSSEDND